MDALEKTYARLKTLGYRLTDQRKEILKVLGQAPGPLTAQEVQTLVSQQLPQVSLDTVYRNLALLGELGIVQQGYLGDRVARFALQTGQEHHHHLVCVRCGQFRQVDLCPMEELAARLKEEWDFYVTGHSFQVYGFCKECR